MNIGNTLLADKLNKIAVIVSIAVVGLVAVMRKIPRLDLGIDFSFLPAIYSATNALVAVCLLFGLYYIRQKRVAEHKRMVTSALILSFLFLLMYVVYHITTPEVQYSTYIKYIMYSTCATIYLIIYLEIQPAFTLMVY